MNHQTQFDWIVSERIDWPPPQRPNPPLGPTMIEIVRSCPLRGCFEASPGYERRQGFASRIGSAFHRTLQSLIERPIIARTIEDASNEAVRRFDEHLREEEARAASRPRERHLPMDQDRIDRAREAVIVEAQRTWRPSLSERAMPTPSKISTPRRSQDAEVDLQSPEGLFIGRIDRVEYSEFGIRLVDYKGAARSDLPSRYERQLQLYAWLWHESFGEWPAEAEVYYPLLSEQRTVSIDPAVCEEVARESAEAIAGLFLGPSYDKLATPGDVCKVCDFRPWCRPFWQWLTQERNPARAWNRATLGIEGVVERIRISDDRQEFWIMWRGVSVELDAERDRFEHLAAARIGHRLRILDARLTGTRQTPQIAVSAYTEVFLVTD